MAVTLTNSTLSTTFDSTEVDANFEDVRSQLASLTTKDIANRAGIQANQLADNQVEVFVSFKFGSEEVDYGGGEDIGDLANKYIGLPGSMNDPSWTIADATVAMLAGSNDVAGTEAPATITLAWGNLSNGAFVNVNTIVSGFYVSSLVGSDGEPVAIDVTGMSNTTISFANGVPFIRCDINQDSLNVDLLSSGDMDVTLRLIRTIRAG